MTIIWVGITNASPTIVRLLQEFSEKFELKCYCTKVPLCDNPHVCTCVIQFVIVDSSNLENGITLLCSYNCQMIIRIRTIA